MALDFGAAMQAIADDPAGYLAMLDQLAEISAPPDIAMTKMIGQQINAQSIPTAAGQQPPAPQGQQGLGQLINPTASRLGAPQAGQQGLTMLPSAPSNFDFNRLIQGA